MGFFNQIGAKISNLLKGVENGLSLTPQNKVKLGGKLTDLITTIYGDDIHTVEQLWILDLKKLLLFANRNTEFDNTDNESAINITGYSSLGASPYSVPIEDDTGAGVRIEGGSSGGQDWKSDDIRLECNNGKLRITGLNEDNFTPILYGKNQYGRVVEVNKYRNYVANIYTEMGLSGSSTVTVLENNIIAGLSWQYNTDIYGDASNVQGYKLVSTGTFIDPNKVWINCSQYINDDTRPLEQLKIFVNNTDEIFFIPTDVLGVSYSLEIRIYN